MEGVNALPRATSISTYISVRNLGKTELVSMPYLGPHPFLLIRHLVQRKLNLCVNALPRATSISTKIFPPQGNNGKNVSMPYLGPHPFLHVGEWLSRDDIYVSMPYLGPHPFLQIFLRIDAV